MKKFLVVFILLLIILATSSYIFLKISAQSTESNFFNDNLRGKFACHPLTRKILGLHFDGDARSDYLGSRYDNITLKIVSMEGLEIDNETAELFADKIQKATEKTTKYSFHSTILFSPTTNSKNLEGIIKNSYDLPSQGAVIYIAIASREDNDGKLLGSTLRENGIVLFKNTAMDSMRSDSAENLKGYLAALMLHEFGHQIGLDHNNIPGCLMNEETEFSDSGRLLDNKSDFCDFEREQIKQISGNIYPLKR